MAGPQRRSRRARKEPPEIVPPKSDEDDPDADEEEESETESTTRKRRGQRGQKSKEASSDDGTSNDEKKNQEGSDTGESSNEEADEGSADDKKPALRTRRSTKKTSESNDEEEEEKTPKRRGRSRKIPDPSSNDEELSDGKKPNRSTRRFKSRKKTPERSSEEESEEESEKKDSRRRRRSRKNPEASSNDEGSKSEPIQKSDPSNNEEGSSEDENETIQRATKRRRGRARKSPEPSSNDEGSRIGQVQKSPRRRGRARKTPEPSSNDESLEDGPRKGPKRRGRHRKSPEHLTDDEEDEESTTKPSRRRGRLRRSPRPSSNDEGSNDEPAEKPATRRRGITSKTQESSSNDEGSGDENHTRATRQRGRHTKPPSVSEKIKEVTRTSGDELSDEDANAGKELEGKSSGSKSDADMDTGTDDQGTKNDAVISNKRIRTTTRQDEEKDSETACQDEEIKKENKKELSLEAEGDGDGVPSETESASVSRRSKRQRSEPQKVPDSNGDGENKVVSEEEDPPKKRSRVENDVSTSDGDKASNNIKDDTMDTEKTQDSIEGASAAVAPKENGGKTDTAVESPSKAGADGQSKPQDSVSLREGGEVKAELASKNVTPAKTLETEIPAMAAEIETGQGTSSVTSSKSIAKYAQAEVLTRSTEASEVLKIDGQSAKSSQSSEDTGPLRGDIKSSDSATSHASANISAEPSTFNKNISDAAPATKTVTSKRNVDDPAKNESDVPAEQGKESRKTEKDANLTSNGPTPATKSTHENSIPMSAPQVNAGAKRPDDDNDSDEFHDAQMELLPPTPVKQVGNVLPGGSESDDGSTPVIALNIPQHDPIEHGMAETNTATLERKLVAVTEDAPKKSKEVGAIEGNNGMLKSASQKDCVRLDCQTNGPESTVLTSEQSSRKIVKEAVVRSITQEDGDQADSQSAASQAEPSSSPITESSEDEYEMEDKMKDPVYDTMQLPFSPSIITPPSSNDDEAKALDGYDGNALNRVKAILYSTGSRVHRGRGFERIFAEYWDAVILKLSDRLTTHASRQCEVALKAFLKSPKLRNIHNKFIISIMKRSMKSFVDMDQVSAHIPAKWHHRVKRIDRVLVQEGPKPMLSQKFVPGRKLKDSSIYSEAWEAASSDSIPLTKAGRQIPSQEVDLKKIYASSSPIPGALVIDPLVREMADKSNMRVSENAVWLLVVAAREHTKNVVKNAISCKKDIEQGRVPATSLCYPNVLAGTKSNTKRDSIQDRPPLADQMQRKFQSRKVVTAFDIFASSASMPSASSASLGGSVSSTALERCLHSAFDSSPFVQGPEFANVQNYIVREITSLARERKRLLPPPSEKKKEQTSQSKEAHQISKRPSPSITIPPVAAAPTLPHTQHVIATQKPVQQAPTQPQQQINPVTGPIATVNTNIAVKAVAPVVLSKESTPALVVPGGLGRGAKNLAALMQRASNKVEDDPNAAPALLPNSAPKEEVDELGTSTGSGRRGKGFGRKNLAAMKARTSKPGQEGSDNSGEVDAPAPTVDAAEKDDVPKAVGAKNLAAIKARSTGNAAPKAEESASLTPAASGKANEGNPRDTGNSKSNAVPSAGPAAPGAKNLAALKARSDEKLKTIAGDSKSSGTSDPVSEAKDIDAKSEAASTATAKTVSPVEENTDQTDPMKKEKVGSKDSVETTSKPELGPIVDLPAGEDAALSASMDKTPDKAGGAIIATEDGSDKALEEVGLVNTESKPAKAESTEETKPLEADSKVAAESKSTPEGQGDGNAGKSSGEGEKVEAGESRNENDAVKLDDESKDSTVVAKDSATSISEAPAEVTLASNPEGSNEPESKTDEKVDKSSANERAPENMN